MNVDVILDTLNRHQVRYLLVGGMNFLLRHQPVLTFDVDVWIDDEPGNRRRCEVALAAMEASWGETEAEWGPVAARAGGWLDRQPVFCLTTPHGSVDVFRMLPGLSGWAAAHAAGVDGRTGDGTAFRGLSDADMLRSQLALPEEERKTDRIRWLERALGGRGHDVR